MSRRFLGVFAHPDDESFGPGGTLAKYASRGIEITLLVASRGEKSTIGQSFERGTADLGSIRERELRYAAGVLGLKEVRVLGYPDTGIQEVDPKELVAVVKSAIEELHPEVVLTFDPGGITGNSDHIAVSQAVTAAVEELYGSEPSGTKLYYWVISESIAALLRQHSDIPFAGPPESAITTVIDVVDFKHKQMEAIACHRTQSDPVPRVLRERLEAQAGREFFIRAGTGTPTGGVEEELF